MNQTKVQEDPLFAHFIPSAEKRKTEVIEHGRKGKGNPGQPRGNPLRNSQPETVFTGGLRHRLSAVHKELGTAPCRLKRSTNKTGRTCTQRARTESKASTKSTDRLRKASCEIPKLINLRYLNFLCRRQRFIIASRRFIAESYFS